jgi:hypothetical protein
MVDSSEEAAEDAAGRLVTLVVQSSRNVVERRASMKCDGRKPHPMMVCDT